MVSDELRKGRKMGRSKLRLAVGAASLFLFIVGIKRSYGVEDSPIEGELEQERTEGAPTQPSAAGV